MSHSLSLALLSLCLFISVNIYFINKFLQKFKIQINFASRSNKKKFYRWKKLFKKHSTYVNLFYHPLSSYLSPPCELCSFCSIVEVSWYLCTVENKTLFTNSKYRLYQPKIWKINYFCTVFSFYCFQQNISLSLTPIFNQDPTTIFKKINNRVLKLCLP